MNGRMEAEQMAAQHEARQPVAWAVMDGTKTLVGYHSCDRVKAEAWAREYGFPEVVPLYRQPQPTLTDAEREAIGVAIQCVEAAMAQRHPEEEDARELLHKTSTTLSRLFDRSATSTR